MFCSPGKTEGVAMSSCSRFSSLRLFIRFIAPHCCNEDRDALPIALRSCLPSHLREQIKFDIRRAHTGISHENAAIGTTTPSDTLQRNCHARQRSSSVRKSVTLCSAVGAHPFRFVQEENPNRSRTFSATAQEIELIVGRTFGSERKISCRPVS